MLLILAGTTALYLGQLMTVDYIISQNQEVPRARTASVSRRRGASWMALEIVRGHASRRSTFAFIWAFSGYFVYNFMEMFYRKNLIFKPRWHFDGLCFEYLVSLSGFICGFLKRAQLCQLPHHYLLLTWWQPASVTKTLHSISKFFTLTVDWR